VSYDPDEMMLELFRAEVESHSDLLTNSLLKLEQSPEATGVLDGMMRAAHSIKGAARIVRVDAAVDVAHVMEDCFVAAQRGELVLDSSGIDVLLKSVDLLVRISEASKTPNVDWTVFDSTIKTTVEQLQCVLNKQPLLASPHVVTTSAAEPKSTDESTHQAPEVETTQSARKPRVSFVDGVSKYEITTPILLLPKMLGAENAESLRLQLIELLSQHEVVSLDMSELRDLDAIGLAWLHSASHFAHANAKKLAFREATPEIAKLFDFIGLPHSRDT
jgi:chemotaxis protein histidine kinase CheA